jgi:spermidine/putrescine transport system substrate-binding protein
MTDSSIQRTVHLAIWSKYLPPELIEEFEKKSGIRVRISHYSSNEELMAKLETGSSEYDVILPSDYMVSVMIHLGLLRELDYHQLKNVQSLDPRFLKKSYDPDNRYALPYDWGTTGIAVDHSQYPGSVKSWKELFLKVDLAGRFSLLDDAREVIGAGLKALGHSLNSVDPVHLSQVKTLLLQVKPRVKLFTSEPLTPLLNREVAVAQIFMSDALQARAIQGQEIEYLVPQEGGTLWIDHLAIPRRAQHPIEAHSLIDFLLEPKTNAETVKRVWVGPANRSAIELLPSQFRNHTTLFPSPGFWSSLEMIQDLGASLVVWDRLWTEVKAR